MHLVIILPNTMQRLRPARKSVGTLILLAPTAIIRPTKRSLHSVMTRFLIKPRLRPVQKRAGMLTIPVLVAITPATKKSLPSVMISPVTHGRVMPTGIGRSAPAAKLPEKRLNIPVARQPVRTEPFVPPVLRPMVHWMPNIM